VPSVGDVVFHCAREQLREDHEDDTPQRTLVMNSVFFKNGQFHYCSILVPQMTREYTLACCGIRFSPESRFEDTFSKIDDPALDILLTEKRREYGALIDNQVAIVVSDPGWRHRPRIEQTCLFRLEHFYKLRHNLRDKVRDNFQESVDNPAEAILAFHWRASDVLQLFSRETGARLLPDLMLPWNSREVGHPILQKVACLDDGELVVITDKTHFIYTQDREWAPLARLCIRDAVVKNGILFVMYHLSHEKQGLARLHQREWVNVFTFADPLPRVANCAFVARDNDT
jgi:hypothetical protein